MQICCTSQKQMTAHYIGKYEGGPLEGMVPCMWHFGNAAVADDVICGLLEGGGRRGGGSRSQATYTLVKPHSQVPGEAGG